MSHTGLDIFPAQSVVVRRELSPKAKLSIYRSIYVPALTHGHVLRVMTKTTRSRIQVTKMSFLHSAAGRSVRQRSPDRHELPLCIERNQFRWFGDLVRMPPC